jgi:mono/diheme cytochrome c family protein
MEVDAMKGKTALAITSSLLAVLLTMSAVGQNPEPGKNEKPKQAANHVTSQSNSERGQQLFNQNCSRCHTAPEAIRPSISATVALHMRIRAGLSEKDYKQLLAFLNP